MIVRGPEHPAPDRASSATLKPDTEDLPPHRTNIRTDTENDILEDTRHQTDNCTREDDRNDGDHNADQRRENVLHTGQHIHQRSPVNYDISHNITHAPKTRPDAPGPDDWLKYDCIANYLTLSVNG